VYGTLKRGFFNNKLIASEGAAFVKTAKTNRAFPLVVGDFGVPYLLPPRPGEGHRIEGELWEATRPRPQHRQQNADNKTLQVDESTLEELDRLERVPAHRPSETCKY